MSPLPRGPQLRAQGELHLPQLRLGLRQSEKIRRAADLRYSGQAYELTVSVAPGSAASDLIEAFSSEHERTYGHRAVDEPVDLVSLRVSAAERVSSNGSPVQRPRHGVGAHQVS